MENNQKKDTKTTLQKIIDTMTYAYPVLAQYPKSEKFALVADIKRSMDIMLERAIEAEKKYYKKTTLQELDAELAKCKIYVQLSYKLGFISFHKMSVWSDHLAEIGRLLGGWIASIKEGTTAKK